MKAPIKHKGSGRSYIFNCTFGGLATFAMAATISLSLLFVLGVLVGRGHKPENAFSRIIASGNAARPSSSEGILTEAQLEYGVELVKKGAEAQPSKSIDAVERKAPMKAKGSGKAVEALKVDKRTDKGKADRPG
jgi:hypothetical protein